MTRSGRFFTNPSSLLLTPTSRTKFNNNNNASSNNNLVQHGSSCYNYCYYYCIKWRFIIGTCTLFCVSVIFGINVRIITNFNKKNNNNNNVVKMTTTITTPPQQQLNEHYVDRSLIVSSPTIPTQTQTQLYNNSNYDSSNSNNNYEPIPRPPLRTLVKGWNITGDVSWLLQYAIVGFPKCGTSSLMYHLRTHPQIDIFKDERCELSYNQQKVLIEDLYRQMPSSTTTTNLRIRAIKCPLDLENTKLSLRNYNTYFPKTHFIVGIRHPVLWFESFYNFRIHNQIKMPPAERLIGKCRKGWQNVCTFRSNFHLFLSNLGYTNIVYDNDEKQLIDSRIQHAIDIVPNTNRRIFLYELTQLQEQDDPIRQQQFLFDLQQFLNVQVPLEPIIWFKPGKNHSVTTATTTTSTTNDNNEYNETRNNNNNNTNSSNITIDRILEDVKKKQINICDDKYIYLRQVLMDTSINVSKWITNYFIHSSNRIVVSSKEYFSTVLMKSWELDPCIERNERKKQNLNEFA